MTVTDLEQSVRGALQEAGLLEYLERMRGWKSVDSALKLDEGLREQRPLRRFCAGLI